MDWKRAAEELAVIIPRERLHARVLSWIEANKRRRGPWVVALSGGADSVCLLLLLWAHWPERRGRLLVAHFNHRLRGRESVADAAFCRRLCRGLGIEVVVGAWREQAGRVSEASAREARLGFLEGVLGERRSRVLWTGHQQDDIAETMLMRLARGSGSAGLSAPRPVQTLPGGRTNLRPLAGLSKADVSKFLIQVGVAWREDSSNATGLYFRNRIRNEVMPLWVASAEGRDALLGAALTRDILEEDEEALQAWLDSLRVLERGPRLLLEPLLGKPRALVRRALHRWLGASPYRGDLSRQGFEQLLSACVDARSTRFSLGVGGFALLRKRVLTYEAV